MEIDGNYQACSFGAPNSEHNILNTTMEEWMVSDTMNGIRTEMLNPDETEYKHVN